MEAEDPLVEKPEGPKPKLKANLKKKKDVGKKKGKKAAQKKY